MAKELRIVFFGTPDFAVASLKALVDANVNVVGVVTAPDKPAGRGQKLQQSAVKKYADQVGITTLQPTNLKSESFLTELKALTPNLQVVVAFRMLPESVWDFPEYGTFNLHGSLLPQYRGAAPINWAIINGEKETGVTTFFLQHEIDTGKIIFQEKTDISASDNAGTVHDKLMDIGAGLVVKTVNAIADDNYTEISQSELFNGVDENKKAYKIFKDTCKIDWNNSTESIYNKIRGLSPYPTAFTIFRNGDKEFNVKLFDVEPITNSSKNYGEITINNNELTIATNNGSIKVNSLQFPGKKRMQTVDFLKGFRPNDNLKAL